MSDNPAASIPEFLSRRTLIRELSDYLGVKLLLRCIFLVVVVVGGR